jgi:hypothetical protein
MIGWSLGMGGIFTLLFGSLFFFGMTGAVVEPTLMLIISVAMLIAGIIGVGLAFGSIDGRAGNPAVVWISVVWNGLMFGIFMVFTVIGIVTTMGAM